VGGTYLQGQPTTSLFKCDLGTKHLLKLYVLILTSFRFFPSSHQGQQSLHNRRLSNTEQTNTYSSWSRISAASQIVLCTSKKGRRPKCKGWQTSRISFSVNLAAMEGVHLERLSYYLQNNHSITEWPGLKRATVIAEFQPPAMCRVTNQQTRLPRATSSLALNASRDGASTASLSNLFSASPPSVWKKKQCRFAEQLLLKHERQLPII